MEAKKIFAKGVSIRIPTGYFPYIGRYIPGKLLKSDLPKPVILVDEFTKTNYEAELVEIVPFSYDVVPTVLCCLAEGAPPTPKVVTDLLTRSKADSIQDLAFYLYKITDGSNHSATNQDLFEKVPSQA